MTKEIVLNYFESSKGEILSGAGLAEKLGVTRTAIWKAINSLREEGYDIESVKKKGYRLNVNSDILSTIKIKANLKEDQYDLRIYKTIDSTNKIAKLAAITEGKEWIVVASEKQEEGKGRGQKHFSSPDGKGVYMSIILRPNVYMDRKKWIIHLSSVAVIEAIKEVVKVEAQIGLPNDIMYEGKKLGGILTEGITELETGKLEAVVIGIGINVYGTIKDFDNQSDDINISLNQITGDYCNRSELMSAILNHMSKYYNEGEIKSEKVECLWNNYLIK